jgi:hypothetical protein
MPDPREASLKAIDAWPYTVQMSEEARDSLAAILLREQNATVRRCAEEVCAGCKSHQPFAAGGLSHQWVDRKVSCGAYALRHAFPLAWKEEE